MGWLAAGTAALGLTAAALNASRNTSGQQQQQSDISQSALAEAEANRQQQNMIQALINKRSIAGYSDSAGSTLSYDPSTNQWVSKLGTLPQQVQTSADQAAVSRNTTDLRQAQFANEQAAKRAAAAQPYADTARRELESYRPMGQDQLVGLLQQQATNASNETYRPLVADTLRQFARTGGTASGPVLASIGKSAAGNLRDSLIDAQIKGMQNVDSINQSRKSGLTSAAQSGAALATPAFGYSTIQPSNYSSTMANLMSQRAGTASTAPAYGSGAVNQAETGAQSAYGTAIKNTVDPNASTNSAISGLNELKTLTGKGGSVSDLVKSLTNKSPSAETVANYGTGSGLTGYTNPTYKLNDPTYSNWFGSGNQQGPVTSDYNFADGTF